MNTNKEVEWKRFIVPKKVEQINDNLFIDTHKSNNIKIGVNDLIIGYTDWNTLTCETKFK